MNKSIIAATVLALMASTANAGIVPSGESLLPPAQGSEPTSSWTNKVEADAMTDEKNVWLSNLSSEYPDEYGQMKQVKLFLRCTDNTTAFILATNEFLSDHNGAGKVTYRVDKNDAVTVNMQDSTNNKSLALWSGSRSIPAIKSMFGGELLTVKFRPYSGSYITVTFDITGIESEITELRETCNW